MNSLLTQEFGKGVDERNLNNMRVFYQVFPIWNAGRTELNWAYKEQSEQIWQMVSAKYLEKSLTFFLAITSVNHYIDTRTPAAPLSHMRNSVGLSIICHEIRVFFLYKIVLTLVSFFAMVNSTKLNNTCHASTGFGPACAPRWVTYTGAW